MVAKQRAIAASANVVMEGRDIGTVVFPDASVKIFLDADPGERVRRRADQLGRAETGATVAKQMAERDTRDRTRAEAPLAQAPDAVYVDSTDLSIEEVMEALLKLVRAAHGQRERLPLSGLLVMKFGGTSMGSAERIRVAAQLVPRTTRASGRWWSWSPRCRR